MAKKFANLINQCQYHNLGYIPQLNERSSIKLAAEGGFGEGGSSEPMEQ